MHHVACYGEHALADPCVAALQRLEATGTASLVQSLIESPTGQVGVLQALQHALKHQPGLKQALEEMCREHE